MFGSILRSWRSSQSLSTIVPLTRNFKSIAIPVKDSGISHLQGYQTAEVHSEIHAPDYTQGQEGLIKKLSRNLKTGINSLWKALSSQAEESSSGKPIKVAELIQRNTEPEMVWVSPEKFDDMERCEDRLPFSLTDPKHFPSTSLKDECIKETEGVQSIINNRYFEKFRWKKEPLPTEKMKSVDAFQNTEKENPEWEGLRYTVQMHTAEQEGQIEKFKRTWESGVNALWEAILSQAQKTCLKKLTEDIDLVCGNTSELMLTSPEALLDDMERCEDRIPPCAVEPEHLPHPCLKDCLQEIEEFWSDIDANWYYEKFPWKKECCEKKMNSFIDQNDDPTANGLL
uniref:Carboxypeptidase D n=1 Tax=Lygus hesperus TaxID=30085 RepID=A0A0A9W7F2_LYGHE